MSPVVNSLAYFGLALCGGMLSFGVIVLIIEAINLVYPFYGQRGRARLERKLERRLARGRDRYFEEKRSIEAALAQVPEKPQWRLHLANVAFLVLLLLPHGLLHAGHHTDVHVRPGNATLGASGCEFHIVHLCREPLLGLSDPE